MFTLKPSYIVFSLPGIEGLGLSSYLILLFLCIVREMTPGPLQEPSLPVESSALIVREFCAPAIPFPARDCLPVFLYEIPAHYENRAHRHTQKVVSVRRKRGRQGGGCGNDTRLHETFTVKRTSVRHWGLSMGLIFSIYLVP